MNKSQKWNKRGIKMLKQEQINRICRWAVELFTSKETKGKRCEIPLPDEEK